MKVYKDVVIKQNSPGYVITAKHLVLNYIALYISMFRGAPRGGVDPPFCFYSEVSKLCKCSTCCYFQTALTEFAPHHTVLKPNRLVGVVVRDSVISASMGGSRGDAPPPHQPFSNMFF